MKRRGELDAIVVGAGAIGAAIALGLARDGCDVALVESREPKGWRVDDEVDPRVVALAPDTRRLLVDLDVWTAIAGARSSAYRRMRVWDASASGELAFDAADSGEAALGWIVENSLIQHVLWNALRDETRVRTHCPASIVDIDDAADAVSMQLDDGTRLRARVLVAADGAESSLRARFGIAFAGRDYAQRAVVAHVATERSHESTAWQRFQPGGPLAFLPLADGRSSVVWTLPDAHAARVLELDDAAFCAELGCAFDFRLGAVTATTPRHAFPLRLRLAGNFVAGRCVLAGDAAHLVHPLAGQGMNLGFRDVRALRRTIDTARRRDADIGAAHVLRRYARERRSDNALAARGLDVIERAFDADNTALTALRSVAFATVQRIAPLRRLMTEIAAGR